MRQQPSCFIVTLVQNSRVNRLAPTLQAGQEGVKKLGSMVGPTAWPWGKVPSESGPKLRPSSGLEERCLEEERKPRAKVMVPLAPPPWPWSVLGVS